MTRYLVDTNHIGEGINRVSLMRERIQQMSKQGNSFGTCGPVLCELQVGIALRKDAAQCRWRLNSLLKTVRLWPIDPEMAEHFAEIYHQLRRAGRVLSFVDILLVVLAQNLKATLLTTDRDFEAIPDIQPQNWLAID